MRTTDLSAVVALQRACFPAPFPEEALWSEAHLREHLRIFASGQFVSVEGRQIIGSASNLIVTDAVWHAHDAWEATTGGFTFAGHDPTGTTLYGADISVHPSSRGQGVGRRLYEARKSLVVTLGLARFGTACRIPGWAAWSLANPGKSRIEYCHGVVTGALTDRTLTPLLRYGLRFVGVSEDHMDDPESGNAAAVLEWVP